MYTYKTDIDYELVAQLDRQGLLEYIKGSFISQRYLDDPNFKFNRRYQVLQTICKMLGITPNNEQWIFLLAECDRLLCEACAGAGKTTMAQLKLIDAKLTRNIPGKQILSLAYNSHAVVDMQERHTEIISKLNRLDIPELKRDLNLCCYTFHKWCRQWVLEYASELGLANTVTGQVNDFILSDAQTKELMKFAVTAYTSQHPDEKLFISDAIVSALISLYSFSHETLTTDSPEDWKMSSAVTELREMPMVTVQSIFKFYNRAKTLKKRMDFVDIVDGMYKLCCNPKIMKRLRANYSVVLVDEYQDITPAMRRVIEIFMEGEKTLGIEPYEKATLICIGDGDQSIYGFRGTDPDNCIRFREMYSHLDGAMVKITSMSENRRCPTNIIDLAREIITSNQKRIDKPLLSIRDGGTVSYHEYTGTVTELNMLVTELKGLPSDALRSCCVAYRNMSSSYMLTVKLMENGVPFRIGKGHSPLSDRMSESILGILLMLTYPDQVSYMQEHLFKVLPKSAKFNKDAIYQLIKKEEDWRRSGEVYHRFWELDFSDETRAISGFDTAIGVLAKAYSEHKRGADMSKYVGSIIKLLRVYYLDWQIQKGTAINEEYVDYLTTWFTRPITFDAFSESRKKLLTAIKENSAKGVYITTMHGLKGLEFDNMYIVDMNDMIFPGTELNTSAGLSQLQKDVLENEARRLLYVAVTRARQNLVVYFDRECASRYIRFFKENQGLSKAYKEFSSRDDVTDTGEFVVYQSDASQVSAEDILSMDEFDGYSMDPGDSIDDILAAASDEQPTQETVMDRLIAESEASTEKLRKAVPTDVFEGLSAKPNLCSLLSQIMSAEIPKEEE